MATLSNEARREIWADAMRQFSLDRETVGLSKTELRAAVNALDAFFSDNVGAVNNAIPQPARGVLTTAQKARLLMMVIQRRYVDGA